jgi:hypothetical protein
MGHHKRANLVIATVETIGIAVSDLPLEFDQ